MASKYGRYPFGQDLYSLRPSVDFEATLSVVMSLAGRVQKIYSSLQGGVSFAMPLTGRLSASLETFEAGLSFSFPMSGILRNNAGFRGDIPVVPSFYGLLFRAAERQFEGDLSLSVSFGGALGIELTLEEAATLNVPILIGGGVDIYIGPFWDPDEPTDGFWVPDVYPSNPITEFWVPDTPQEEIWASDTPINQDWFPSHPQVVPGTEKLPFGINAFGIGLYSLSVPPIPLQIWVPIPQERNYNG